MRTIYQSGDRFSEPRYFHEQMIAWQQRQTERQYNSNTVTCTHITWNRFSSVCLPPQTQMWRKTSDRFVNNKVIAAFGHLQPWNSQFPMEKPSYPSFCSVPFDIWCTTICPLFNQHVTKVYRLCQKNVPFVPRMSLAKNCVTKPPQRIKPRFAALHW